MTRIFASILLLLILFFLQAGLFPALLPYGLIPHFLLAGIVLWVVFEDDLLALTWSAIGGVLLDLLSPDMFGLQTFMLLTCVGLLIGLRERVMSTKSRFVHISMMFVGSLFVLFVPLIVRPVIRVFSPDILVPEYSLILFSFLGVSLVLNLLVVILLRPVFHRLLEAFLFISQRRSRLKPFGP